MEIREINKTTETLPIQTSELVKLKTLFEVFEEPVTKELISDVFNTEVIFVQLEKLSGKLYEEDTYLYNLKFCNIDIIIELNLDNKLDLLSFIDEVLINKIKTQPLVLNDTSMQVIYFEVVQINDLFYCKMSKKNEEYYFSVREIFKLKKLIEHIPINYFLAFGKEDEKIDFINDVERENILEKVDFIEINEQQEQINGLQFPENVVNRIQ